VNYTPRVLCTLYILDVDAMDATVRRGFEEFKAKTSRNDNDDDDDKTSRLYGLYRII